METMIIGPQPPPLGGISVYLYRLRKRQPGTRFIDETRMGKRGWLKLLFLTRKHFVYHSPSLRRRLWLFALTCLNRSVFTLVVHGDSLQNQYTGGGALVRLLIGKMLRKADSVQVVNPAIKEFMVSGLGVERAKIDVISSFLPPPPEDEAGILASYDPETVSFVSGRSPLIVANAHRLCFHQGVDLYGLDMCLDLIADLKSKVSDQVGLVFALAQIGDESYYREMRARCSALGIEANVHFLTGQKELWPLFKRAQLMVRPTCTDGFGISVAEALHFRCPAVASDVCRRAEGTVLFANRDSVDFRNKCLGILASRKDIP